MHIAMADLCPYAMKNTNGIAWLWYNVDSDQRHGRLGEAPIPLRHPNVDPFY